MLEKTLRTLPKEKLVKGKWYVGRGRNSNIGYWNGDYFIVTGLTFRQPVIKYEGYYGDEGGCFQPFYKVEEGILIDFPDRSKDKYELFVSEPNGYLLEREECEYLLDSELPALVLALRERYDLKDQKGWRNIVHQTAGHGVHQHTMIGRVLQPRPGIVDKMKEIEQHWVNSQQGIGGVNLDDILIYREQLKRLLGVDCNMAYTDFEEGIYPIDCTSENLKRLALDELPKSLNEFIDFGESMIKWARWNLYILGRNSD